MSRGLRSRARFTLAAGLMAAALLATLASVARAQVVADPDYWKHDAASRSTVERFAYTQSPQAVPSMYDPVAEAEGILRERQRTLAPTNPEARRLWTQIRELTVRARLGVPMRVLGSVGLAAGAFELGWKIGTGINTKFLRIGIGPAGTQGASYCTSPWPCTQSIRYVKSTTVSPSKPFPDWGGDPYPTDEGGVFAWHWSGCNAFSCWTHSVRQVPAGNACLGDPAIAAWAHIMNAMSLGLRCSATPVAVQAGYVLPSELESNGPVEPYTGQPFTSTGTPPVPPTPETVSDEIEQTLDDPDFEPLRDWLNYALGSPGAIDPTGEGEPNSEIEFPDYVQHWFDHGDEFSPAYDDPAEYWRDAADIVKRKRDGDPTILRCDRGGDDPAELFWDPERQAIVVVKDGKIVTYFVPDDGFQYWVEQCGTPTP